MSSDGQETKKAIANYLIRDEAYASYRGTNAEAHFDIHEIAGQFQVVLSA